MCIIIMHELYNLVLLEYKLTSEMDNPPAADSINLTIINKQLLFLNQRMLLMLSNKTWKLKGLVYIYMYYIYK